MSDQRLSQAKNSFAQAKGNYFKQKEDALKKFNKAKEYGMVSEDATFVSWRLSNCPQFNQAEQQLQSTNVQVQHAAAAVAKQGDIWSVLDKNEYLLLPEDRPGREHMEGVLL